MRKYWQANPDSLKNVHLLPMHEALHAAVAEVFGAELRYIRLRKRTGLMDYRPNPLPVGWQEAAVKLAPALIDDMAPGDQDSLSYVSSRRRGYAWGWLLRNRTPLLRRARSIVDQMGTPPGVLKRNGEEWRWISGGGRTTAKRP